MSFLANYLNWTAGDECPEQFHLWAGLFTVSSLVARRVWYVNGRYKTYPNLYLVFVGTPGSRKSTAMGNSRDFLQACKDIHFGADCATVEQITRQMVLSGKEEYLLGSETATQHQIVFCLHELTNFISISKANMIEFFTTIYEGRDYSYKTKGKGSDDVTNPCVNLFACTTTENIAKCLQSDIISGGFSRRVLFVHGKRSKRVPKPTRTEAQESIVPHEMLPYAKKLRKVSGQMFMNKEANAFYEDWYHNMKIPSDPCLIAYYESKQDQLFKVSMLTSLAESLELEIRQDHVESALVALDNMEVSLPKVFSGLGRNELNNVASNLLDVLRTSGGIIEKRKLSTIMYREVNHQELRGVLEHLSDTGKIKTLDETVQVHDRKITRQYIVTPEVGQEAVRRFASMPQNGSDPVTSSSQSCSDAGTQQQTALRETQADQAN